MIQIYPRAKKVFSIHDYRDRAPITSANLRSIKEESKILLQSILTDIKDSGAGEVHRLSDYKASPGHHSAVNKFLPGYECYVPTNYFMILKPHHTDKSEMLTVGFPSVFDLAAKAGTVECNLNALIYLLIQDQDLSMPQISTITGESAQNLYRLKAKILSYGLGLGLGYRVQIKETVRLLYSDLGLSIARLTELFGLTESTIKSWLLQQRKTRTAAVESIVSTALHSGLSDVQRYHEMKKLMEKIENYKQFFSTLTRNLES